MRHARSVMVDLMQHGGVAATPDDVLSAPIGTVIVEADGQPRAVPPEGVWWALLDSLRAIDNEKGGA